MKIYYITRTWPNEKNSKSCALLRKNQAEFLGEFGKVVIVTPSYDANEFISDERISFRYSTRHEKIDRRLQSLKILEDSLDSWVKKTVCYLEKVVLAEDIVFSSTGGELACIKIGSLLKIKIGCKFIIHFRDPVDGDILHKRMAPGYKGFSRKELVDKYCSNADGIITYSEQYAEILRERSWANEKIISGNYIGYREKVTLPDFVPKHKKEINIVYAGTATYIQNCEILYEYLRGIEGIKITYIVGEPEKLKARMPEQNINCIPLMSHDDFLKYMINNADVGFLSLKGQYFKTATTSKLYEYINLGLPILAAVQKDGAAAEIIEKNHFGIVCDENDRESFLVGAQKMLDMESLNEFRKSIYLHRDEWHYIETGKQFKKIIRDIIEADKCVE